MKTYKLIKTYPGSFPLGHLAVLGLICIVFGLYLFIEQAGKDLNFIDNNEKNQSWI